MARVELGPGEIEYQDEPALRDGLPPLVFLHEGLGSIETWRGFPEAVRRATGGPRTFAYARHGYGRSDPLPEPRTLEYMHDEALVTLPDLLERFQLDRPVLIGHSDGASIAVVHAGAGYPVSGLVLLAPHVFVEDCTLAGIEAAVEAYRTTDLPTRLARRHADADAVFRSWSETWLRPEFRAWNIEAYLGGITAPVLVVQGEDDEYGTLAQLDAIERGVKGDVHRVVLPGVGHAPHLEDPAATVRHVADFCHRLTEVRAGRDTASAVRPAAASGAEEGS